jgi:hypothetical protein
MSSSAKRQPQQPRAEIAKVRRPKVKGRDPEVLIIEGDLEAAVRKAMRKPAPKKG